MVGKPFQKGNPGKPKGAVCKVTAEVKEVIENVFKNIGGEWAMSEWAKTHKDSFFTIIYPKLLPKNIELGGKEGQPIRIEIIKKYLAIAEQALPVIVPDKENKE